MDAAEVKAFLEKYPEKADEPALIFLDEERHHFPAECNRCNRTITNREFAAGEAVLNDVGEMWHRKCEDE